MVGPRYCACHSSRTVGPTELTYKVRNNQHMFQRKLILLLPAPPTMITHKHTPFYIEVKAFQVVSLRNSTFIVVILSFLKFIKQLNLDT